MEFPFTPARLTELCVLGLKGIDARLTELQGELAEKRRQCESMAHTMFVDERHPVQMRVKAIGVEIDEIGTFVTFLHDPQIYIRHDELRTLWYCRPGPQHLEFQDLNRLVETPTTPGSNTWNDSVVETYQRFVAAVMGL